MFPATFSMMYGGLLVMSNMHSRVGAGADCAAVAHMPKKYMQGFPLPNTRLSREVQDYQL
jgi:hypothetical protein